MAPPSSLLNPTTTTPMAASNATPASTPTSTPAASAAASAAAPLAELDPSKLKVTLTALPRPLRQPEAPAQWGRTDATTDHMITVRWTDTVGWLAPELRPYGRLDLWPTASCLHYATECFEGLKAYRGHDGKLRLFRPARNAARLLVSASRIACPSFPPHAVEALIAALLAVDAARWLPEPCSFLYVRPAVIGTGRALGMHRPREALLYIVLALFPALDAPLRLLASPAESVRAWPGGFGFAKVGANYGPSLLAQGEARRRGYDQVLWLFGRDAAVTEAGAANFFCVVRPKAAPASAPARPQLLTAPLGDKTILDGVTRRSVLDLAADRLAAELEVAERTFTMAELARAHDDGRLLEAFAVGTAYFVAPVMAIHFGGRDLAPARAGQPGSYTARLKQWLADIMYGRCPHEWAVVVDEPPPPLLPKLPLRAPEPPVSAADVDALVLRIKELRANRAWHAAFERVRSEDLGED